VRIFKKIFVHFANKSIARRNRLWYRTGHFSRMPTYEYHCEKCGKNFEAFQSMKDAPFNSCPQEHCQQKKWGKGKVKRLLGTGAGIIFKGSGFYITDYRSKGYQEAAKKESSTTSGGGDSSAKQTEAKPSTPCSASTEKKPKPAKGKD